MSLGLSLVWSLPVPVAGVSASALGAVATELYLLTAVAIVATVIAALVVEGSDRITMAAAQDVVGMPARA